MRFAVRSAMLGLFPLLTATAPAAPSADDLALYERWCARCHGQAGDGKGLAAPSLALNHQAPRDFTAAVFKLKTTRAGTGVADADLRRVIEKGIPGTSMPYFSDLLSGAEIERLVGVVRSFARMAPPAGVPLDLGPPPSDTAAERSRGAALYTSAGCPACHGSAGRGDGMAAPQLLNADGSRAIAADLTRPWAFRGGAEVREITMRLAVGMPGTPMPSYLDVAPLADLWAVALFVRSLARAPSLEQAARDRAREPPGNGESSRARGEYLVKSGTCFLCHVQMNPDGSYREGSFGAGGMKVAIGNLGVVYTRNITPDVETGIGTWSADDLRRAFREGRSRGGRALSPLDMPWTILAELTDPDIEAIHTYLRSLPAVRNQVPSPEGPGWIDGVFGKLITLLSGRLIGAGYHPPNASVAHGTVGEARNPRGDLIAFTCCLALVFTSLILLATRKPARRGPRRAAIVVLLIAASLALLYVWPPLARMPASLLRAQPPYQAVAHLLRLPPIRPAPEPIGLATEDDLALAKRGRYVATIGTCPLCHTAGPNLPRLYRPFPDLGGGMKINWNVFGTTYSRNLTPDRETGLGTWTNEQIRRAIVSGIARDGRLMHWQAMPWDHFSTLSLEDLEALIFYLRHLPPVYSKVPDPEPPRSGDAEADTFYFGYIGEYRSE